jgi:four helix bundle protein
VLEPATPDIEQWERRLPDSVTGDSIWKVSAYKHALYARKCAWPDSVKVARHRLGVPIARQLYRAVASIAANIADGWSRTTGLDRARFFEYALSSAREAIVWYLAATPILRPMLTRQRMSHLAELRRLLLVMIQTERRRRGRVTRGSNQHEDKSN